MAEGGCKDQDNAPSVPGQASQLSDLERRIMEAVRIASQQDLEGLLREIDWHDSFIREVVSVSSSWVLEGQGTVNPDALPSARLRIITMSRECPGVDLSFEGVKVLDLDFKADVEPVGRVDSWGVWLSLSGRASDGGIRAEAMFVTRLGLDCWTRKPSLVWDEEPGEDETDSSGEATAGG